MFQFASCFILCFGMTAEFDAVRQFLSARDWDGIDVVFMDSVMDTLERMCLKVAISFLTLTCAFCLLPVPWSFRCCG